MPENREKKKPSRTFFVTRMVRTVLITGCSSGIGRATAEKFHDEGWRVYATARNTDDIQDLAEKGTETLELDVTEDEDIENAVETVVDEEGGIGCVVNNAGYGEMRAMEEVSVEELHSQMEVNTYGPHRLALEALPQMREQGDGTIVNISSVSGRVSTPGTGAYCASKHALEAVSDAMRAEVERFGVDVVLVEPGPVRTPFGDKVTDDLAERGLEDSPYRDLYEQILDFNEGVKDVESPSGLSRILGTIAVPPEKVADEILDAATASNPRARYTVSVPHRVMAMGRYVPAEVRDWTYNRML